MSDDSNLDDLFEEASRVEAAEAGAHHEVAESREGVEPREHVTPAPVIHHHHPADPNAGIVRAKPAPHALFAGTLAAAVTVVGVVLLALAIGSH